jgi:hypothetical protein
MTRSGLWLAVLLVACTKEPVEEAAEPFVPTPPVAFLGDWIRIAPAAIRGDTLRLRADSTADGVIPWPPNRMARISRWKIRFGSKDPVGTRADWRQGYTDGGDAECVLRDGGPECVSLPLLCLGASGEYMCSAFAFTPDSLSLASGLRYIRLRDRPATAAPSGT